MGTVKYLRIIGVLEIIAAVISMVYLFVLMIGASAGSAWALAQLGSRNDYYGTTVRLGTGLLLLYWTIFVFYCFFAPGVGVLFLTVADLAEKASTQRPRIRPIETEKNNPLDE